MKTASIAIFSAITMIEHVSAYDDELIEYYSRDKPNSGFFESRAGKEEIIRNRENTEKAETKISSYPYSIKKSETDEILGYYIVSSLNPKFHPFTQVFSNFEVDPKNGDVNKGGLVFQLSITRPAVVELYDADLTTENLTLLSNINSIEYLGLPRRGLVFTKSFKFPENLRTLVIRNTTINLFLIEALSDLEHIENLVFIDCGLEFKSFESRGSDFLDAWWGEEPRIFKKISTKIQKIKVFNSDPDIFNFIAREEWINLEQIQITLYPSNILAASYLGGPRLGIRNVFPALEVLTVLYYGNMYSYFDSNTIPKGIKIINQ